MSDHESNTAEQKKTSQMAIASLILALFGWCLLVVVTDFVLENPLILVLLWLLSIGLGVTSLLVIRVKHFKAKVLAVSGVILSVLPIVFGIWCILTFLPNKVTKVSKYGEIRHKLLHNKQISHFPEEIPDSAKDVRMSYFPGFLQGGGWFQLRMTLHEDRISKLFQEFDSKKIKSFQGGSSYDHVHSEGGVTTTYFRTSESYLRDSSGNFGGDDFPDDFIIMVLASSGGNHGNSHGVAISKAKNQIVYWTDFW